MKYGSGKYTYELVDEWAKLPEGWSFLDIGGLAIDSQDRVYVLNRSSHPVMVFDRDGKFLGSWGEGYFKRAHGIRMSQDGTIYCTDDENHTVSQFTPEGKVVKVLGNKGKPSDTGYIQQPDLLKSLATIKRGGPPFNRPTGVALSSSGEIFVSDGYGNARVHKFSREGKLLLSWGKPGTKPGQFRLPHNIWIDKQDRVWVPDRENSRIQVFDTNGKFLTQWTDLLRPADIFIDNEGTVYVSELDPRVSIFTNGGKLLARWGTPEKDPMKAQLGSPHAISVDSRGDIYIGSIDRGVQKFARKG